MYKILLFLLFPMLCAAQTPQYIGSSVVNIQTGSTFDNLAFVYVGSDGKAYKASGTDETKFAQAIALDTSTAINQNVQIAFSGQIVNFPGISKGRTYYIDTGIEGGITATKPAIGPAQSIGDGLQDSVLLLNFNKPVQSLSTGEKWIVLASDAANSTVTLANITGFSFTAAANSFYLVRFFGSGTHAATTTGIGIVLDTPADGFVMGSVSAQLAAQTYTSMQQVSDGAIAGTNSTNGTGTSGVASNTLLTSTKGEWIVKTITGGTVQMQFRSEIAASNVTLSADRTRMMYRRIN